MVFRTLLAASLLTGACQTSQRKSALAPSDAPVIPDGFFPLMSWESPSRPNPRLDDPRQGLASFADCGYTTIAFVRPHHLPACEKLGVKAIVSAARGRMKWSKLSDEQIDAHFKSLVDQSRGSDAVLGYFITDEPGAGEFPALAKAVAAVKRYAPGKLAYINLYPDYATIGDASFSQLGTATYTEYLERFVREVQPQILSYDNYRVLISNDLKDTAKAASYFRNLLEVRRVAQEHGLPFWNIASSNQIRPFTPIPSPANLLFQAYTTLAAGAHGLTWFTYYQGGYQLGPVDNAGRRTTLWSYLKMVNEQVRTIGPIMRTLKSTGVYFTAPPPAEGLPGLPGSIVTEVNTTGSLMIGEFAGPSGEPWVMLVNLSLSDSVKYQFKTSKPFMASSYVSPADGSLVPLDREKPQWLTAGQGVLIKLE
jgi:hypothetical protein